MQNEEPKSELPAQPSDTLRDVDSTRLLGKELPDCEGKWIRAGGNNYACTVQWEKPIPDDRRFRRLIIFFKRGNYWRVDWLPSGMRGGWHFMPNPSVDARQAQQPTKEAR